MPLTRPDLIDGGAKLTPGCSGRSDSARKVSRSEGHLEKLRPLCGIPLLARHSACWMWLRLRPDHRMPVQSAHVRGERRRHHRRVHS